MVFLNLTKHFNRWLGPFLLRNGLKARYRLGGGVIRDSARMDIMLCIPLAQKLISLEVHDECQQAVTNGRVEASWKESLFGRSRKTSDGQHETTARAAAAAAATPATIRLQVLEKYLRPALVNNEQWSNVRTWQFHNRLLKWARTELLMAKHGPELRAALDAFPALRQSPQLTGSRRLQGKFSQMITAAAGQLPFDKPKTTKKDDNKLPSTATLTKALGMHRWSSDRKDIGASHQEMARIAQLLRDGKLMELRGKSLAFVHAAPDQDLSNLSLEEILEVAGGHVTFCGPFNALCEEADVYQLWTKEYIEALGEYLLKRTASFGGETVVLDVGAGDGLLAQSLRRYFDNGPQLQQQQQQQRKVKTGRGSRRSGPVQPLKQPLRQYSKIPSVVATDDGSWSISRKATVEQLSVEESIARYAADDANAEQQVIVICSWMPMNEDWTAMFRKGGVDEYILIGECDDGQCGDNWETWGNLHFRPDVAEQELADAMASDDDDDDDDDDTKGDKLVAETAVLYQADGYERKDLDDLVPFQLSRFDCAVSKFGKTVSFRKGH